MERDIEIKRAANNSFMPYYYGDGQERANLCEAFHQGAVWQDRQKAAFQREKAVEVSKNYSESEFGLEGDNDWTAGQFNNIENAFVKGARWASNNPKEKQTDNKENNENNTKRY